MLNLMKSKRESLDTKKEIFFYEQEFYVLSNFSSFRIYWKDLDFTSLEYAYQWEKFPKHPDLQHMIWAAASSHDAYTIAQDWKHLRREDWPSVCRSIMKDLCRTKVTQHPYVRKKLLESGDRTLIENSYKDSYWGWGPDKKGANMLGTIWMELRNELTR